MKIAALAFAGMMAGALTAPASAHHSFVGFDQRKSVEMTGTVQALEWMNPHSMLRVSVQDPKTSMDVQWVLQMAPPERAIKSGWMHNSLKPGDRVTVTIHPAKDGSFSGELIAATLPDGTMVGGAEPVAGKRG